MRFFVPFCVLATVGGLILTGFFIGTSYAPERVLSKTEVVTDYDALDKCESRYTKATRIINDQIYIINHALDVIWDWTWEDILEFRSKPKPPHLETLEAISGTIHEPIMLRL